MKVEFYKAWELDRPICIRNIEGNPCRNDDVNLGELGKWRINAIEWQATVEDVKYQDLVAAKILVLPKG